MALVQAINQLSGSKPESRSQSYNFVSSQPLTASVKRTQKAGKGLILLWNSYQCLE
jgi:hypothetical protein